MLLFLFTSPFPRPLFALYFASSSIGRPAVCVCVCGCPAALRDLRAGIMQSMVTITHNNRCAEMLATVRRGPFARPTPEERIEFLLTRVRKTDCKVAFADHALEHTLSFQRRVHSIKQGFLKRAVTTPLGVTQDYWDRMQREITPFVKRFVESNDETNHRKT